MHQLIEGVDNEVCAIALFAGVLFAVIVPFYVMRPARRTQERSSSQTNSETNRNEDNDEATPSSNDSRSEAPNMNSDNGTNAFIEFASNLRSRINTGGTLYPNLNTQSLNGSVSPNDATAPSSHDNITSGETSNDTDAPSQGTAVENISVKVIHQESHQIHNVDKNTKLGDFKRICFPTEYDEGKSIRLIFSGRMLQGETYPLRYLGIMNGSVIHSVISERQSENTDNAHQGDALVNDLDLSNLTSLLFTIILVSLWTLLMFYPKYFSLTSIVILGFLTILFVLFVFAS